MNFLEQLASEWYTYKGYFVRTNIKMNRRPRGGYDNELDVLAYSARDGELIHIESSWDALTWADRKRRFTEKKFVYSRADYEAVVGAQIATLKKIALVGLGRNVRNQADVDWGPEIEIVFVPTFIATISADLAQRDPMNDIVPEGFPRLRAMQFALRYGVCDESTRCRP